MRQDDIETAALRARYLIMEKGRSGDPTPVRSADPFRETESDQTRQNKTDGSVITEPSAVGGGEGI
ncbi:MAG: hypothetical protein SYR96_06595 [Actinomycetota bacterium]|nr:hypothetical protein [Actinomycetota bacterium]